MDTVADPEPPRAATSLDRCTFQFLNDDDNVINRTLANKFTELSSADIAALPRLPRVSITKSLQSIITDVDSCVAHVLSGFTPSLLHCVYLIHAAVATVMELQSKVESRSHNTRGSWRQRLESKIAALQCDLSQLVAGGYLPWGGRHLLHELCHLYSKFAIVSESTFSVAVETLKQQVSSFATHLRRYKIRLQRYWQNTLFQRNESKFYSELLQSKHDGLKPPELSQLELFWKGIFEKNSDANLQAPWLLELQSQLACKSYSTETPVIDHHCFRSCLKRLRNWAAPGPDGVQGFWIKRFSALHSVFISHYSTM